MTTPRRAATMAAALALSLPLTVVASSPAQAATPPSCVRLETRMLAADLWEQTVTNGCATTQNVRARMEWAPGLPYPSACLAYAPGQKRRLALISWGGPYVTAIESC